MNSSDRITENTDSKVNETIKKFTDQSVLYYSNHPELISERLKELDREWDIERVLQTNAASILLGSIFMSIFSSRKWLFLSAAVSGFLLQHSIHGWCPPLSVFRKIGVRTCGEIQKEKIALMALQGAFDKISENKNDPAVRVNEILNALE